ncbi:MAG: hypothetical protein ACE5I1_24715, partial [bacterium]
KFKEKGIRLERISPGPKENKTKEFWPTYPYAAPPISADRHAQRYLLSEQKNLANRAAELIAANFE